MIVAIHQPQYLPWLGYFDKIDRADVFCFLDNVQYKKNEWQNRNRIKTAQGPQWLTVPVRYRFPQKINDVAVNNNEKWAKKQLQSIVTNYSRTPFFKDYIQLFEEGLGRHWESISDLNIYFVERLIAALGIETPTIRASELDLSDDPTGRLVDICRAAGGNTYLAGQDGGKYMDMDQFRKSGIDVLTQSFSHPLYSQLFGEFISHLSVVDLIFNCGPNSLKIIRG